MCSDLNLACKKAYIGILTSFTLNNFFHQQKTFEKTLKNGFCRGKNVVLQFIHIKIKI